MNADSTAPDAAAHGDASRPVDPLRRRDLGALLLVALLGLAVRLVGLGDAPLWLDEATTAAFASRGVAGASTAEIHHPPLHYAITAATLEAFAPPPRTTHVEGVHDDVVRGAAASNALVRLPALVFGVLLVPALAFLARRLAPRGRGRVAFHAAAVLVACSPFCVAMSREARDYALYLLLATCATHAFLAVVWPLGGGRSRPRALVAYSVLSLALAYTHHVAILVLVAHEAVHARVAWRRRRDGLAPTVPLRRWLLARVCVFAAFLPWVVWVTARVASGAAHLEARAWVGSPLERIPIALVRFFGGYGVAPERTDPAGLPPSALLWRDGPVALAVILPMAALAAWGWRSSAWRAASRAPIAATLLVPYAVLLPLTPWTRMIHERYLCYQAPLLLAVAALGFASLGARTRRIVGAAALAASLVALGAERPAVREAVGVGAEAYGEVGKEAWDRAARFTREQGVDAIVLAPDFVYLAFDRAWVQQGSGEGRQPVRRGWPPASASEAGETADAISLPEDVRRVAVVTRRLDADEPRLLRALPPGRLVAERWYPQQSGIRVRVFDVRP